MWGRFTICSLLNRCKYRTARLALVYANGDFLTKACRVPNPVADGGTRDAATLRIKPHGPEERSRDGGPGYAKLHSGGLRYLAPKRLR